MLIRNRVRIWTLACLNQSMGSWPHWMAFVTAQMLSQGPLVFQKPCLESLKSVLNLLFHWAFSFIEPSYSMGHCTTGVLFLNDQKPFSPLFSPASYTRLPVISCCLLRLSPDVSSCTQAPSSIHHAWSCLEYVWSSWFSHWKGPPCHSTSLLFTWPILELSTPNWPAALILGRGRLEHISTVM